VTRSVGFPPEMDPFALDPGTADRLLIGLVDVGDAPPEYRAVARTLQALRSAPDSLEWAGQLDAVDRIAEAVLTQRGVAPRRRRSSSRAARLAVSAFVAGAVCVTGGFASAGALPEPAQNAAAKVLGTVGISVPTRGDDPAGVEEPPVTTGGTVPTPPTSPVQPSPDAGASAVTPASPAAPGNTAGEVQGAPADGTPPNAAKGHGSDHPSNGSPPAGVKNGNHP
jgi:hypothetical protein